MIRPKGMAPAAFFAYTASFKKLNLKPCRISQTVGNAKASAGFHKVDGYLTINGKREGYCAATDLSVHYDSDGNPRELSASQIKAILEMLSRHGFVGWYRDWPGNKHIHIVWVNVKMKPQLQRQVQDFLHNRDGLAGHQPETFYTAPKEYDDLLRAAFLEVNKV